MGQKMHKPTISDMNAIHFHGYLLNDLGMSLRDANEICHLKVNRLTDKEVRDLNKKITTIINETEDWKWDSVVGKALPDLKKALKIEMENRYV